MHKGSEKPTDLIVKMGDCVVSDNPEDTLKTFSVASCVTVCAYSKEKHAAGMIHIVLPSPSNGSSQMVLSRPSYFAITGIPLLINLMTQKFGCRKDELEIHIYGGASLNRDYDVFHIGEENIKAVKDALNKMGVSLNKCDLRGQESRSISMNVKTGCVEVLRQPIPDIRRKLT